jgi:hypothetical protein
MRCNLCPYKGGQLGCSMSKSAREYHLIDLVGLRAWDIFHGNDRIEYHDPDDRKTSDVKEQQDRWMCLPLHAPTNHVSS